VRIDGDLAEFKFTVNDNPEGLIGADEVCANDHHTRVWSSDNLAIVIVVLLSHPDRHYENGQTVWAKCYVVLFTPFSRNFENFCTDDDDMKSVKSNFQVQQSSEVDVAMRNTLQERSSFLDEGLPLSRYTDLHETSLYCQGAPPPTSEEGPR